jgi:hypothetical protein
MCMLIGDWLLVTVHASFLWTKLSAQLQIVRMYVLRNTTTDSMQEGGVLQELPRSPM